MKKRLIFKLIFICLVLATITCVEASDNSEYIAEGSLRPDLETTLLTTEQRASNKCGENLTWSISSSAVLTISGTGRMDSYTYYNKYDSTDAPWENYNIHKVVIEEGVTSIGRSAFWGDAVQEVVLPDSLTEIEPNAFYACGELKKITLGNGLQLVGKGAFGACPKLLSIYVPSLEAWCKIDFGDTYANPSSTKSVYLNGSTSYYYPTIYANGVRVPANLVIPEGITKIGDFSFAGRKISSVAFPNSLETIGDGAFAGVKLSDITIPNGVVSIGRMAFQNTNISVIDLPDSVKLIGEYAFASNYELVSLDLPSELTELSSHVFYNCTKLNNVVIPSTVTTLGEGVFNACPIKTIEIPKGVTSIGKSAFAGCNRLNNVLIPDTVTFIGRSAFSNCTALQTVTIPEKLDFIPDYAFSGCTLLNKVVILGDVLEIGNSAFENCTSLIDMSLSDSVKLIGDKAFRGCSVWKNARVPLSVATIGEYAYSGCLELKLVHIPSTIENIKQYSFENCSGIESLTFDEGIKQIESNVFYGCTGISEIRFPSTVTILDPNALKGVSNLQLVTFSGSAPTIAINAFYDLTVTCYYPKDDETYTREILTSDFGGILTWTYEGEVLPDDFNYCGKYIMWEITDEGILVLSGNGEMYDFNADDFIYANWYESRDSIVGIIIGEGITHIGDYAFYSCTKVKNVTIADSVKTIGKYAFYNCRFEQIELPDILKRIGEYAFKQTSLSSIVVPDSVSVIGEGVFEQTLLVDAVLPKYLESIPDALFQSCFYLRTVNIPDTVISIGNSAFSNCYALYSMVLPEGLISIGNSAFNSCGPSNLMSGYYECSNFKSVKLPSTLEYIGKYAFYYCQSLSEIVIPNNVKELGLYTFGYCYSLKSVTIPAGIKNIDSDAFLGCKALKTVTFRWNAPDIHNDTFGQVKATCYYPSNNEAWTNDMLQNYGGTLTWVPLEMEKPEGLGGGSGEGAGDNEGDDSGVGGGTGSETGSDDNTDGDSNEGNTGGNQEGSGSGGNQGGNVPGSGGNGSGEGGNEPGSGSSIHSHGYESILTEPTCTENGYITYSCVCGHSYIDDYIEKMGHTYGTPVTEFEVSATCTVDGSYDTVVYCTVCDAELSRVTTKVPAMGHDYDAVVTLPTCTEQGFTTYTCYCGDAYISDYVVAFDHTWSEWVVVEEATETNVGSAKRTCETCKTEEVKTLPVLEHKHKYSSVVTEPTCTEQGYTTYTCHCGDTFVSDYVVATGHAEVIDSAVSSTCTSPGLTEGKHCSVCNEILTAQQTTDALGHDFSHEWTVDIEPTTTTLGQKSRHCSRCDEVTDIIEIAKLVEIIDTSKKFTDVTDSWSKPGIDYVVSYGYMNGTGNGSTFSPSGTMSRSMIVTVLYRIAGQPSHSGYDPFTDISTGWYYDAVLWAYENGIVTGTSKTTFAPDGAVTREQMATFLYRFAKYMGYDVSKTNDISTFPDASKVGSWAYDALAWANAEGLITGAKGGDGVTRLDPQGNATREQVATILMRFCEGFSVNE